MSNHTILHFVAITVFYLLILHWISCLFSNYILRTKTSYHQISFFTNGSTQQQKDQKRRHDSFVGNISAAAPASTYMAIPEYANNASPSTNHTVDVPVNTPYQCSNFCGPTSTCSITGEQCTSDIDCQGCQPPVSTTNPSNNSGKMEGIRGDNDAGKLTGGVTPQYSTLTQPFGTTSAVYGNSNNTLATPPAMPYLGKDTWITSFNEGTQVFNDKLAGEYAREPEKYTKYASQVVHPTTKSVTGLFDVTGPMAANT